MSILQELWYGNIHPNEYKVITDEEKRLVELIARHHEILSSSLKNDSSNSLFLSRKKNRHPTGCLFLFGRGIRIRTLNDGVRDAQCFSKNDHYKHVSGLACLSNVSVNFVAFLNTKL